MSVENVRADISLTVKTNKKKNKAENTATPVACGRGGAVLKKEHLGKSSRLKNAKKVKRGPTDQPTDRRTDIAGCRVA